MTAIRILADDLTGALDTAAAFAGKVPVHIGHPPAKDVFPVSVTALPTRDAAADALPGLLAPVLDWFTSGSLSFKKVDSLLRGNVFAEIAWLFENAAFSRVVFIPAFPSQGRITTDDRQWIVHSEKERQAVAGPLGTSFVELGLRPGKRLEERADVWIPDVATDGELDDIVRQVSGNGAISSRNGNEMRRRAAGTPVVRQGEAGKTLLKGIMWAGSAGLGHALARRFGLSAGMGAASPPAALPGPTVLVSSSFQPVFREQWAVLRAKRPVRAVAEAGDTVRISLAIEEARNGAREVWFDLSPRAMLDFGEAGRRGLEHTKTLVENLPVPGQLIVIGGDTLLGLCRATGAAGLLTHPPIRSGLGCARIEGGAWNGVPCNSRSRAFGAADDLVSLYSLLVHPENSN